MTERAELSQVSDIIVEEVFRSFKEDEKGFIRSSIAIMEQRNPLMLDNYLEVAASVSIFEDPKSAQQLLAGSLFLYRCVDKELSIKGEKMPEIGDNSIKDAGAETLKITQDASLSGMNHGALLIQMIRQLEGDNPNIGALANKLVKQEQNPQEKIDAFIQGMQSMQIVFKNVGTTHRGKSAMTLSEIPQRFVVPQVRRSIARRAILESILDRNNFVSGTLDTIEEVSPDLSDKVVEVRQSSLPHSDIYELVACVELYCLLEEFKERKMLFPIITRRDIEETSRTPELARAMRRGDRNVGELLRQFQTSILKEMEDNNPHLYWCLMPFVKGSAQLRSALPAAINGVVHQYNTLKFSLSKNK